LRGPGNRSIEERKAEARRLQLGQLVHKPPARPSSEKKGHTGTYQPPAVKHAVYEQPQDRKCLRAHVVLRNTNHESTRVASLDFRSKPLAVRIAERIALREWAMVSRLTSNGSLVHGQERWDVTAEGGLEVILRPLVFLEVTAVDSSRTDSFERITAKDNARYDRRWRWFTEPGCRIFTFRTLQPRISVVFDTQRTLEWDSSMYDGRLFALFECARDNPGQSVEVPCVVGIIDEGVACITQQPLRPGTVYCFSVNDWQLREDVNSFSLRQQLSTSAAASSLSAPLLALIESYLPPEPVPLLRVRLHSLQPRDAPSESLGGWRLFFQVTPPAMQVAKS
jgi:hypothetical protein